MKKTIPIIIAVLVFFVALGLSKPEKQTNVVVAAVDMPARHTIQEGDVILKAFPESSIPQGAFTDLQALYGQTLRFDRMAGDIILPAHLGGERLELQPDERAIALKVNDSAGLAGLIQPGDLVGVTAVLRSVNGTFSKYVAGGLRVLYISPEFRINQPEAKPTQSSGGFANGMMGQERANSGVVVLAVPVKTEVLLYDFPFDDGTTLSEKRMVNLVDLLPALDQAQDVELSLILESPAAADFNSPGIYLPDLALTPEPTATPDLTATALYTPVATDTTTAPVETPTPTPASYYQPGEVFTPTPFGR